MPACGMAGAVPVTNGRKKVILRTFSSGLLRGYLPPSGFVRRETDRAFLELLDLEGRVQALPIEDVRLVSFVRDFNVNDDANPERLLRKVFLARPRAEGLWVRLTLRDDDVLEGLAPLDLALAESFADDLGIQVVPPDVRGNTQRLYVPRSALLAMQVVAVVTTPSRRNALERVPQVPAEDRAQLPLGLQP